MRGLALHLLKRLRNFFWVLFLPVSLFWPLVAYLRRRFYPRAWKYTSSIPVICVGNIHSGGSGKTPVVAALYEHFQNKAPVILSRGYRAQVACRGSWVDNTAQNGPELFGDEPWMLAQQLGAKIYVDAKRVRGIKAIEAQANAQLVLLDDGFQHFALNRDADLLLINTSRSLEESFCLPYGDLRESLSAIHAATAVILVNKGTQESLGAWKEFLERNHPTTPLYEAQVVSKGLWMGNEPYEPKPQEKFAAFCGIAQPDSFQRDLTSLAPAIFLSSFPDHHEYTSNDIRLLIKHAIESGADTFVTTDKDWFKVKDEFVTQGQKLVSLRIGIQLPEEFWEFLSEHLRSKGHTT